MDGAWRNRGLAAGEVQLKVKRFGVLQQWCSESKLVHGARRVNDSDLRCLYSCSTAVP